MAAVYTAYSEPTMHCILLVTSAFDVVVMGSEMKWGHPESVPGHDVGLSLE